MNLILRNSPLLLGLALCAWCRADTPIEAESVLIRIIDEVNVPARTAGVLSGIDVVEGQRVDNRQQLAHIDDVEARLFQKRAEIEFGISQHRANDDIPVRSALKKLEFNRSNVRRVRRAAAAVPGSISAAQMEETELRLSQAVLDLEQAKRDLELARMSQRLKKNQFELSKRNVEIHKIVSPLNGVVVEVLAKTGEWVEPGEKVLRIVRMDRLRAEGLVPAEKVLGLAVGAPVRVSADVAGGMPSVEFEGEIVFVSPEINPVNGQVRVWAEVDNESGLLRPGLRPRMSIQPGKKRSADQELGTRDQRGLDQRP